jgi:hypothetical protein
MVTCDSCGYTRAVSTERDNSIRVDCPRCGHVELIWNDGGMYVWDCDGDGDSDLEPHVSVDGWGEEGMP